jgi:hypothetical protein
MKQNKETAVATESNFVIKKSNATFEIVLIAITILLGFTTLVSDDLLGFLLFWLLVLGFLQVSHSLIIIISYWRYVKIRKVIFSYWIGVIIELVLIFPNNILTRTNSFIYMAAALSIPLSLAIYLLWITCYFCGPGKKV